MIEKLISYKTTDGQIFDDEVQANDHQQRLDKLESKKPLSQWLAIKFPDADKLLLAKIAEMLIEHNDESINLIHSAARAQYINNGPFLRHPKSKYVHPDELFDVIFRR